MVYPLRVIEHMVETSAGNGSHGRYPLRVVSPCTQTHSNNNVIQEPHVETIQFFCTPLSKNDTRSGVRISCSGLSDFRTFRTFDNNAIHEPHVETRQLFCTPLSKNNIRSGGQQIIFRDFRTSGLSDFKYVFKFGIPHE